MGISLYDTDGDIISYNYKLQELVNDTINIIS